MVSDEAGPVGVPRPKPAHLGRDYAAQFADPSVVAAYRHRPPYPAAVFPFLAGLARDEPRAVLDIGCGRGEIARRLVGLVDRVDAVDISAPMVAAGRQLPRGDHPALRWIVEAVETAPLDPPYALVTAGSSLHWMDWQVVLPGLRDALTANGVLAVVDQVEVGKPWVAALQPVIDRLSTNREYRPYDLLAELEGRNLFRRLGEYQTEPVSFVQSVAEYVESFHARNGFSRDRMPPADAAAFDQEAAAVVAPHAIDWRVRLGVAGRGVWGRPAPVHA